MKPLSTFFKPFIISLVFLNTLAYSQYWSSGKYEPSEYVEWYCERLVPGAYPSPLGVPRSPLLVRLQEMMKMMKTIYIEISGIFEDGPTYIPTLEELLYRRRSRITKLPANLREDEDQERKAHFRRKLRDIFSKKPFFLNGKVS